MNNPNHPNRRTKSNLLCLTALLPTIIALVLQQPASAAPTTTPSNPVHKPAPQSQINWNHPLAKNLVSAVPLNEGAGTTFYDAVTKESYSAQTLTGSSKDAGPPAWITPAVSPDYPWIGPAISNNTATAQAIRSTLKDAQFIQNVTTGYSYAVLLEPLDTQTFGRIMDGTGAAVITLYLNIPGRTGLLSTTCRSATKIAINPSYKFQPNQWVLVLCTIQDGLGIMYINGKEVARDANVDLKNSAAGQRGQLIYNATGSGSMMCNANFSSFWIWNNRVLTPQEAADLYTNPWAMFEPATTTPSTTQTSH